MESLFCPISQFKVSGTQSKFSTYLLPKFDLRVWSGHSLWTNLVKWKENVLSESKINSEIV